MVLVRPKSEMNVNALCVSAQVITEYIRYRTFAATQQGDNIKKNIIINIHSEPASEDLRHGIHSSDVSVLDALALPMFLVSFRQQKILYAYFLYSNSLGSI